MLCLKYNWRNDVKKALIIFGILAIAIGIFIFTSPKSDVTTTTPTSTKRTFSSVQADVTKGAHLIDVRTPEEYAAGHFANATNFDSVKVEAGQLPDLSKSAKVYLYCHSGRRAGIVLAAMKKAGFTDVTSLGGLTDVQAIGGKLE